MESNEQVCSDITLKIRSLEALSGDELKSEMSALKKAIMENPQACSLLLPEDIGLMVSSLRRIVGTAIVAASTKKTKERKPSTKKMTAAELAAALDDEDF